MLLWVTGVAAPAPDNWPSGTGGWLQGWLAVLVVLALVGTLAWLLKRGAFGRFGRGQNRALAIEASVPLGDRRSLVIVTVEGRRLLLGLTSAQVSLVAELEPSGTAFDRALAERLTDPAGTTP